MPRGRGTPCRRPWISRLLGALLGAALLAPAGAVGAEADVPALFVLEDATGQRTLEQVTAQRDQFRRLDGDRLSVGFTRSAYWLRFELPARPAAGGRLVIEAGTPVVDRIELHAMTAGGAPVHQVTGDGVPFAGRGYPHRRPTFVLGSSPEPVTVLLRVATESTAIVPVRVWREADFLASAAADERRYGLYFGFLAAMLAFNLFLFLAVRDASYLWYVAYMASLVLLQAKLLGYADEHLWPAAPHLANPANLLAFAALVGFGAQFTRSFLAGAPADRLAAPAIVALQVVSLAAALSLTVVPYGIAIQAMIAIGLLAALLLSAVMVRAYWRGYRPARYILLSFAALITGGIPYMLRVTGVVGEGFPAGESLDAATAAEALLLSFALADRINELRAQRLAAETSLRDARLRFTERLIESQDDDRRRIAGELHDALGQNVLVLRNHLLGLLRRPEAAAARDELTMLADVTGDMTEQVRTMARDLHPPELERLGLHAALEGMVRRSLAEQDLAWRCEVTAAEDAIAPAHRMHIYRIAQEAVTNVLKHADARSVTLSLTEADGRVRLVIEDDGVGLAGAHGSSGFGLASIRERVRVIGGTLDIEPGSAGGTRLAVAFARTAAS